MLIFLQPFRIPVALFFLSDAVRPVLAVCAGDAPLRSGPGVELGPSVFATPDAVSVRW